MTAREVIGAMSSVARGTLLLAAACWVVAIAAAISMLLGNPAAINGVVSFSPVGTMMTCAGVSLARQDIRFRDQRRLP